MVSNEMRKLIRRMDMENIPYEAIELCEGVQVGYPNLDKFICSVICHKFSYGWQDGLLEVMGLVDVDKVGDVVEGYLTADEVFERISNHYNNEEV